MKTTTKLLACILLIVCLTTVPMLLVGAEDGMIVFPDDGPMIGGIDSDKPAMLFETDGNGVLLRVSLDEDYIESIVGSPLFSFAVTMLYENCSEVVLPDVVQVMSSGCLDKFTGLTSVTIPAEVTAIASSVFDHCSKLTTVTYQGTEEMWNEISIGSGNDPLLNAEIVFQPVGCDHIYLAEDYIEPTCVEEGYTVYVCDYCEDTYFDDYIPALGHSWGAWYVISAPTCTDVGTERQDCVDCDEYELRDVAALDHNYSAVVTAPTCTEAGYTTYTCVCGDSYTDDAVAALGHDYTAVVTAPTCTEAGYTTYTCACGDSYTDDAVAALGHQMSGGSCTRCGLSDGYSQGLVFKKNGLMGYYVTGLGTCTDSVLVIPPYTPDGHAVTGIGASAIGRNDTITEIVLPGSIQFVSLDAFTECSKLSCVTIPGTVSSVLFPIFTDHVDFDILFYGTRSEWDACKVIFRTTNMKLFMTSDRETHDHVFSSVAAMTDPTCTQEGFSAYYCACGTKSGETVTEAALGHDPVDAWSCDNEKHWKTCAVCNVKVEEAAHTIAKWTVDSTAENGLSSMLRATCSCGTLMVENAMAKLTGASLALGEKLSLKYYAILPADNMNAVMRFTYEGETYDVVGVKDAESGEYVFTFDRIPPSNMAAVVKAELILVGEDSSETVLAVKEEYSITQYCEDAKQDNPDDDSLNHLLNDLKAYNKAAEDYQNGVSGDPSDVDWEPVTDTDFSLSESATEDIRFKAAGVRFGYVNRLFFRFTAPDLTGLTVTLNGRVYTESDFKPVEGAENMYILYSEGIYATEFDTVFTIVLAVDGETVQTLEYSVKSYVEAKQNDPEMGALVRALYNYGKSSELYRDSQ